MPWPTTSGGLLTSCPAILLLDVTLLKERVNWEVVRLMNILKTAGHVHNLWLAPHIWRFFSCHTAPFFVYSTDPKASYLGGKKAVFPKSLWQEQSDITFRGTSGISPIVAINENSSSNFQRIGIGGCSSCIKPGSDMV